MKKTILVAILLLSGCTTIKNDESSFLSELISHEVLTIESTTVTTSTSSQGELPILTGYYESANGKVGQSLKTALHNIIKNHYSVSYGSLYGSSGWMSKIDKKPNGKVWDIYSDIPDGTPAYTYNFSNTCGNYSKEGDCWNREHVIPQSIFNESSPMVSDIFHLYPTDGYVNGRRSNYPLGVVSTASWTSTNGSKLGNNTFEPIDEYKGDLARVYFYFVTRYEDKLSTFKSYEMFGNGLLGLSTSTQRTLLAWHNSDPVSQKEIERNEAIFKDIQHNRNPFVDYPELANYIWKA
jgi:endonuclease I